MKNNNKELIDLIRDGLKSAEELPYKEGAWEAYKAKHEPTGNVRHLAPLWMVAAVAALAGFVFLFNNDKHTDDAVTVVTVEQHDDKQHPVETDQGRSMPVEQDGTAEVERLASADRVYEERGSTPTELLAGDRPQLAMQDMETLTTINRTSLDLLHIAVTPTLHVKMNTPDFIAPGDAVRPVQPMGWGDDLVPGQQIDPNFAYKNEAARDLSPKKIRFTDRFEMGAFVSPSSTDRSFDLGGGLVFAYRFNDKIAIRTGASFNQYEVGMLGSQVQEVHEEKIMQSSAPVENSDKLISKQTNALRNSNLFIPNLNAVTGKIQTLDIPLEVRYNLTNQFYAVGGVSYAAVLSQERFDHFEESVGIPTYSSASDSEQPARNPVTTVETTVRSEDNNVNTNGFGGFVNFSVGRKANIGKTMKISVEPFVKLPVGQFRRADMNYTNGGIRVITSF